jgi:hypothetical protein
MNVGVHVLNWQVVEVGKKRATEPTRPLTRDRWARMRHTALNQEQMRGPCSGQGYSAMWAGASIVKILVKSDLRV